MLTLRQIPAAEVYQLIAADARSAGHPGVKVCDARPILEPWHNQSIGWYTNGHRDSGARTWSEYVDRMVSILRTADDWPFPPIVVDGKTLLDGHHRTQAALAAGWDKPIPAQTYDY